MHNTREKSSARLSPRPPRRRESKRHLFVVDSLDKHMQNEKELIRLRRFMPAGAPAARTTFHQGGLILPAAQNTRTRHQRGAIFYLCGE
jgi:hypothetical protein